MEELKEVLDLQQNIFNFLLDVKRIEEEDRTPYVSDEDLDDMIMTITASQMALISIAVDMHKE